MWQLFSGLWMVQGTVSDEKLKDDKRYSVTFEHGEEYDYRKAEIDEFVELREIPIGDVGWCFLREVEGDFFSCRVEKIIIE